MKTNPLDRQPTPDDSRRDDECERFDLGDGLVLRLRRETPEEVDPKDPADGVGDHFFGRLLRLAKEAELRSGPKAPGPLDEIDPCFLAIKAITFNLVRQLFRDQCVTHIRPNREGPCAATAALAAWWAPVGRFARPKPGWPPFLGPLGMFTLARAGIVPLETAVALPYVPSDPELWTAGQKRAVDDFVRVVGPAYDAWSEDVFKRAMTKPTSARHHAISGAWRDWWDHRIASWWKVDVDGPDLVSGFEGMAKRFRNLAHAWKNALREQGYDALATARDLAAAYTDHASSVFLTADGQATFNFRGALSAEARRQKAERKHRKLEVPLSELARPGGEGPHPEPAAEEREHIGDTMEAIRAILLAKHRRLRARFRVLGAGADTMAAHRRIARRLAWRLWTKRDAAGVSRRTGVNRGNLLTAWKEWEGVLRGDPEVVRILKEAADLS